MNLCVDVGNTTITFALIDKTIIKESKHFTLESFSTAQWKKFVNENLGEANINKIIYSSVAPSVDEPLIKALKESYKCNIYRINENTNLGFSLGKDIHEKVGDDLLADLAYAAYFEEGPSIVVDLGTASKILLLEKGKIFNACLILPGIILSINALTKNAELLNDIDSKRPKSVYATNTTDAINAAVMYGHVDMVVGLVRRLEKEIGYKCKIFLTGGSINELDGLFPNDFTYVKDLNLIALNEILERN